MDTQQIWLVILSSTVISAFVSAVIGGWVTLRAKQKEYANEYYKLVLTRRIEAYEEVERLITMLKTAVIDTDKQPYHILFSKDDDSQGVYTLLFAVMSKTLWFSDELFQLIRDFNILVYSHAKDEIGLIAFGKNHYIRIAELRTKIEIIHVRDMLILYDVRRFLKRKKPANGFDLIKTQD